MVTLIHYDPIENEATAISGILSPVSCHLQHINQLNKLIKNRGRQCGNEAMI